MLKDILYNSKVLDGLFVESDFLFLNSADNEISELNNDLKNQKVYREHIINYINNLENNSTFDTNNTLVEAKGIFEVINTNIKSIYYLQEEFKLLEKNIIEFVVDLENNNFSQNTNIDEIKSKINSYSNLYRDIKGNIVSNDLKIKDFFSKVNIKIQSQIDSDDEYSDMNYSLANFSEENITDNIQLIISETQKKVFLPYTRDEILGFMRKYPNVYKRGKDVVEQEFIVPLSTYSKHPTLARFREGYSLIRDREMKSIMDAFKYAIDLMFKYDLNPAIIAACKSEKQLDDYLKCLENKRLDDFKHFYIKFEIAPFAVKNKNEY